MNTPKLLEPANVIRGAATEVVLQSEVLPEVPFDMRNPAAYRNAVLNHLVDELQPRVQRWIEENLTGQVRVVQALHSLVWSYNSLLQRHAGERMSNMEWYPTRLPMDGNAALTLPIQLDGDVQHALQQGGADAVAKLGPGPSLDVARLHYQQLLCNARQALVRTLVPSGPTWHTDRGAQETHAARLLWTLLPFAYRHIEEYVAQHLVTGRTLDMPTPNLHGPAQQSDSASSLLSVSQQEYEKYHRVLDRLAREVREVRRMYGEHRRADAHRTHLGRMLSSWMGKFPSEECIAVLRMVDEEHRIDRARQMNERIHQGWSQALALEHAPSDLDVQSAFRQVDAILIDLPTRLGLLLRELEGDYEGK